MPLTKFNIPVWWKSDKIKIMKNLPQQDTNYILQTYSRIHTQWGKTESITSKIKNESNISTLLSLIHNEI
jgi:hypothetical protein